MEEGLSLTEQIHKLNDLLSSKKLILQVNFFFPIKNKFSVLSGYYCRYIPLRIMSHFLRLSSMKQ